LLCLYVIVPFFALAQTADTAIAQIITDDDYTDFQSMTASDIQRFLERKNSSLRTYGMTLDSGERISAALHIYRVAQIYRINPKVILTVLQKEQSLIEDGAPQQSQIDWAMGYGCFDGQQCDDHWRGLAKQISSAAEQMRYYFDHVTEFNFQPNKTSVVDATMVTPTNIATAALYNYTPHLHGNVMFQNLWNRYFVTKLPDGTVVQAPGDPLVWLIQGGQRRLFASALALASRANKNAIVTIRPADLMNYAVGPDIQFAQYALLRGNPSGRIYLLVNDQKRWIVSMDVFRTLGFNPEEVEQVSDEGLVAIADGSVIAMGDAHPTGSFLRDAASKNLYYVESGHKYPVVDAAIMSINYPTLRSLTVPTTVLDSYMTSLPMTLKNGILIKGSAPDIYVISNGMKLLIPTESVFRSIGYAWANVRVVNDAVLAVHPAGAPLELTN
jgi:hypothetical protein